MSTASAVAVALPATGLVVAVVLASWRLTWRGLSDRMDEQGRRLNEHGDRLTAPASPATPGSARVRRPPH
ncbi:MAG: hypothetical protein OXG69_04520, partial [bacterium]|nr:hypothetical protein [bacterium]